MVEHVQQFILVALNPLLSTRDSLFRQLLGHCLLQQLLCSLDLCVPKRREKKIVGEQRRSAWQQRQAALARARRGFLRGGQFLPAL